MWILNLLVWEQPCLYPHRRESDLNRYPSEHLFMIYSHFWAVLQAEGAGHRWWAVGFAYRVLQRCWTMPMLPPFAHWPSGASSIQVGCSEHRHQPLPGSVGLSRSQCSRWSEEPGSGSQVRQVSLITSLQNIWSFTSKDDLVHLQTLGRVERSK